MTTSAEGLRAVLLVGGRGLRLRPFTVSFPKALMPLGDVPILEVLLRRLADFGVRDITLALGHLSELIRAYIDQRPALRDLLELHYVVEPEPLGTAGALQLVSGLDSTFLAMNGDILTDLDFHDLVRFHRESDAALTIATHRRSVKIDYGVLRARDGRVVGYDEKPELDYLVSMGIYVYEPRALAAMPPGHIDFPDLVLRLLDVGEHVASYETDCIWLDIGRPDDYGLAQEMVESGRL
jgi:NDP-sugar pyrophosphorylase family protein